MQIRSLGREDPLEEEIATHSSILAWEIPWTEEIAAWWAAVRGVARTVGRDLMAGHTHTPSDPRDGLCGVRLQAEGLPQTSLSHSLELIASPACLWTVVLRTPPPLEFFFFFFSKSALCVFVIAGRGCICRSRGVLVASSDACGCGGANSPALLASDQGRPRAH